VKALLFERSLPRYAAARVAGSLVPGAGSRVGPLKLIDTDEPAIPGAGWQRVRPLVSGICGSDLSTIDGHSSRYFEAIVSFPFTPGHEVVGLLDDDTRVVIEPVLGCQARGVEPMCAACAAGETGSCQRLAFGHLSPGLQTGFCADTGGGWSAALVAHESQLHPVPDTMSDEAAVMVEPTACAVHAALAAAGPAGDLSGATVVVLGAGTLGLCTVAALRSLALPGTVIVAAKHPEQRDLARQLGATVVAAPDEVLRAVRRTTRSMEVGDRLSDGADVVIDCVGSADSLASALAVVRPRGRIVMVGMPGRVSVDLTPLWHREVQLAGAYAYGVEGGTGGQRTFALAMELVTEADLGRLVTALYPLERYAEAIEHAASAGRRGAVKIAFDLRRPLRRSDRP
jgi:threonine dehydrogenase-like Zn-dependent dehydrogenase